MPPVDILRATTMKSSVSEYVNISMKKAKNREDFNTPGVTQLYSDVGTPRKIDKLSM